MARIFLSPANRYGEERDVLVAALLLCSDGGLERQTHGVALVRQLHIPPALRAQAAQPRLALHSVRLPALFHHSHKFGRLVGLCACMMQLLHVNLDSSAPPPHY